MSIHFHTLTIDEIRDETADAFSIFFQPPESKLFDYLAGQYLTLKVYIKGEEYRRAYSLASSPAVDNRLQVTIKRLEDGLVSNFLRNQLRPGDHIEVLPPMGNFVMENESDRALNYVLIGAGSGITPLMSILKTVLATEPENKVTLWYGNRSEDTIIFKDDLIALSKAYPDRLHIHYTLSRPDDDWKGFTGRLDKNRVYDLLSELFMTDEHWKVYYICGPTTMMDEAEAAMAKHAVDPLNVHREYFTAPLPSDEDLSRQYGSPDDEGPQSYSDGDQEYPLVQQTVSLTLDSETHQLDVPPDKVILDVAIEAQLDPPYSCQAGICTSCKAMLKSGLVAMDETHGLTDEELEEGYILTCQAHPLTDDVEVDFDL